MLLMRLAEQESPKQVQGGEGNFFAKILASTKMQLSSKK